MKFNKVDLANLVFSYFKINCAGTEREKAKKYTLLNFNQVHHFACDLPRCSPLVVYIPYSRSKFGTMIPTFVSESKTIYSA